MLYHGGTVQGRIPDEVHSRLRDLSDTFGGSYVYWLNRLFMYGFHNEPELQSALAQQEDKDDPDQ